MAESVQVRRSTALTDQKVWTFELRGGHPFLLDLQDRLGPGHFHDGKWTLWKFVGTDEESLEAEQTLLAASEGLRIKRYTEVEDAEMLAIRRELLGFSADDGEG